MNTASDTILEVQDLGVKLNSFPILTGISFAVQRGEILTLLGPNGSGKTVLLKAILGLLTSTGRVQWSPGIRIGYIPQSLSIETSMPLTVAEFFSLKKTPHERALELLTSVGMGTETAPLNQLMAQRIGELSGGQLQRVLIAWTLGDKPDILLFDEPTAGVDVLGQETIYQRLEKLRDEQGLTIILVSHDMSIVFAYADRVLCINRALICQGVPKDVLDAGTLRTLYGTNVHVYEHQHP